MIAPVNHNIKEYNKIGLERQRASKKHKKPHQLVLYIYIYIYIEAK
jgi:hypothetical protein